MSLITIPRIVQWRSNACNGMVPNAFMWRQLVEGENHITAYRHREVYRKGLELGTDVSGAQAMTGYFRFRTGYGVNKCTVVALMGYTTASAGAGSTADPYLTVTFSGITAFKLPGSVKSAGTIYDAPDEAWLVSRDVDVSEATAYTVSYVPSNYCRCLAFMVYEQAPTTVDEATSFMNTHSPTGGSPIYDADRQRLLEGLSKQYRQNGGIVAHWGKFDAAAQTRSSATPANMINGTTTGTPTVGADPGWYIDPRYHRTASRTVVPMEWGVYASMSAGTGTCRIIDSAGATYGSISVNSASLQWWTASFDIAEAAELFLVPQMAGDGAGTLSVYGASLIEYEP